MFFNGGVKLYQDDGLGGALLLCAMRHGDVEGHFARAERETRAGWKEMRERSVSEDGLGRVAGDDGWLSGGGRFGGCWPVWRGGGHLLDWDRGSLGARIGYAIKR